MTPQEKLEALLKFKGIGPKGSKCLKSDQLADLDELLRNPAVSEITKGTFLTAFAMLENNEEETAWLEKFKASSDLSLEKYLEGDFGKLLQEIIAKKDLGKEEAYNAVKTLLDEKTPEVQKGIFLEAERLKRETHEENLAFLNSMWDLCERVQTDLPLLIDLADNYDGYNRTICWTPFVSCVIAACGYPVVFHGVESLAPKFGVTSNQVLQEAKKKPYVSIADGLKQLENNGVVYLDQKVYFPKMYALQKMRKEMVKRPLLATFEKWMQPIRAKEGNTMAMGYTHTAYRSMLGNIITDFAKTQKSLIVRGIEGSPRAPLSRDSNVVYYDGRESHDEFFRPTEFGLEMREEPVDKELSARDSYLRGLKVLEGDSGTDRDVLVYWAVSLLAGFRLLTDEEALAKVIESIDSGKALDKWKNLNP